MSIDKANVIDFLWTDGTHTVLTISDHRDWEEDDADEHLSLLQDKLNHYIQFVESGQLAEMRPKYKGLPILLHVAAKYPLSEYAEDYYELAAERCAELGFTLMFDLGGKLIDHKKPADGESTRH